MDVSLHELSGAPKQDEGLVFMELMEPIHVNLVSPAYVAKRGIPP